jgi:predicted dehydrogenase
MSLTQKNTDTNTDKNNSGHKIRWGVLSTSNFAQKRTIPSMQQGQFTEIVGISSRNLETAQAVASRLGIPKAYDSHEALLADPEIDAVYNPLPNHLHIPLTIQALEAGKHVLCEKPLAMNAQEVALLTDTMKKFPHLKVMEAFMYRFHPQSLKIKEMVQNGEIGEVKTIHGFFSYHNTDPKNVRHVADWGGGGLMDIGCYCISMARWLFGREPKRVTAMMELDPTFQTDRLASAMMDFSTETHLATATFTCATQLQFFQCVHVVGTEGAIVAEMPFPSPDMECTLKIRKGNEWHSIEFPLTDAYIFQGDLFSQAIIHDTPVPTPLSDALGNMRTLDAVRHSAEAGTWIEVER